MSSSHCLATDIDVNQQDDSVHELFLSNYPVLLKVATRITGCRSYAEDVVQDAFIRLTRSQLTTTVKSQVSYIFQVVRNLSIDQRAITVAQRAVTLDAAGQAWVRLVAADGTVSSRAIRTDGVDQDRWIVSEGLVAGERVITNGLQHVRDGQRVRVMDDSRVATVPLPD